MAIETVEREIDGVVYKCGQLPAMRAVKLLNRLGRVLGPTLAKLGAALPATGGKLSDLDLSRLDFAKVGDAVSLLFEKLDDETLEKLLRELLSGVSFEEPDGKIGPLFPDSRTLAFDQHFKGRILSVGRVAAFAFEVNFGGFSDALAALLPHVKAAAGEGKAAPSSSAASTT